VSIDHGCCTPLTQYVLGHLACPYFARDTVQITSSSCTTAIPQEATLVGKQRVLVPTRDSTEPVKVRLQG
jgi:hypothetical protein